MQLIIQKQTPDSLDPYKLTMTENGMYTQYDVANNIVEGGTWSVSGDQLTLNTPDTSLVLSSKLYQ